MRTIRSRKEVEEHSLTHIPYRNWCPHCIRARDKDLDHRSTVEEGRRKRELSFDCFPEDEKGARKWVFVRRERITGVTMATVVLVKGTSGQCAAMKVLESVKECGAPRAHGRRSQDERSGHHCGKFSGWQWQHQNTHIEGRKVGDIHGGVRGVPHQPKDGKTAYERCRGKRSTVMGRYVRTGWRTSEWRVRRDRGRDVDRWRPQGRWLTSRRSSKAVGRTGRSVVRSTPVWWQTQKSSLHESSTVKKE